MEDLKLFPEDCTRNFQLTKIHKFLLKQTSWIEMMVFNIIIKNSFSLVRGMQWGSRKKLHDSKIVIIGGQASADKKHSDQTLSLTMQDKLKIEISVLMLLQKYFVIK